MAELPPFVVAPLGLLAMVAYWYGLVFVLAELSGWRKLQQRFAVERAAISVPMSRMSVRLGWVRYNLVVLAGADQDALYLGVSMLFRGPHKWLRIPWSSLRYEAEAFGYPAWKGEELTVDPEGVAVRLRTGRSVVRLLPDGLVLGDLRKGQVLVVEPVA